MQNNSVSDSHMRWFFLFLIALWIFAGMAVPVIIFYWTKSPHSFWLFGTLAPLRDVLNRLAQHLFPLSDNDTKIALAKQQKKNTATSRTKLPP